MLQSVKRRTIFATGRCSDCQVTRGFLEVAEIKLSRAPLRGHTFLLFLHRHAIICKEEMHWIRCDTFFLLVSMCPFNSSVLTLPLCTLPAASCNGQKPHCWAIRAAALVDVQWAENDSIQVSTTTMFWLIRWFCVSSWDPWAWQRDPTRLLIRPSSLTPVLRNTTPRYADPTPGFLIEPSVALPAVNNRSWHRLTGAGSGAAAAEERHEPPFKGACHHLGYQTFGRRPGASNPMSEREKLRPQITLLIPRRDAPLQPRCSPSHFNL